METETIYDREFSVIIPTWQRAPYIGRAIRSAAQQDCVERSGIEIIVIDDGSTDGTNKIVKALQQEFKDSDIVYLQLGHIGQPGTVRNQGLTQARGQYICYLDSDDFWLPHHLATVKREFQKHPDVGMVETHWALAHFRGMDVNYIVPTHDMSVSNTNCRVHKRECLSVGGFNETRWGEDGEFFDRVRSKFGSVKIPTITAVNGYILRGNNLSYEADSKIRRQYMEDKCEPDPKRGPAISVLMPVYNGCENGKEPWLQQAVHSIIDQTEKDWEFVIVDDGSTDETPKVLKALAQRDRRIRVITNKKNLKIVAALNRGLEDCRAPLVARQDADDMSTVTRLELERKFLDARPDTAMVGSGMYVINGVGKLEREVRHPCAYVQIRQGLKQGCMFVHGSVMFRKDIVLSLGGYSADPLHEFAEDYELWTRLARQHIVENYPDRSLYFHRNHDSKSSLLHRETQQKSTREVMSLAQRTL